MTDTRNADTVRALWALPGMDDPDWVSAQLEQRGQRTILDGERFETTDPLGATVAFNIPRWAILGGCEPTVGAVPTAQQINRGRLVAAMLAEGDAA